MILLTALFMTVSASAASIVDSGECGENLTWVLDSEGTLTIEGSGAMDNWADTPIPWDSYYADIRTVSLPKGLTSVGDYAFYYCNSLTSINFPDGLERIGKGGTRIILVLLDTGQKQLALDEHKLARHHDKFAGKLKIQRLRLGYI